MEASGNSSGRRSRWEIATLVGVGALAAWLRLRALDLAEFKTDEATAVDLARRILDGDLLSVGLVSSIGANNPPLFVYLTAIPLALRDDPLAATAFVAVLSVVAVILTYVVLRPRFGALVALGSAALFATAPWAVLYSRKLWGQSVLTVVTVSLLWTLFVVLERSRSRAVWVLPVLLCAAFQLNLSAIALALPAGVVLAYRSRDVHWRAFLAGAGVAGLLLAPWLYHQATSAFTDIAVLLPGGEGRAAGSEPDAFAAVRLTAQLVGVGDWEYVAADSLPSFVSDAGRTWKVARGASLLATALLAFGLYTCVLHSVRGARTRRRWPWLELDAGSAYRALLLVWLAGVCVVYATPITDRLFPHYLIVTFPVVFAVQALGLADLVGALRGGLRRLATVGAIATLVVISAGYVAFTVSFHTFLDSVGGTAGDYGVVYRDKAALADLVRERGLRVANEPVVDFLVTGDARRPLGSPPFVTVTDRLHNASAPCAGERRSFGKLDACLAGRRAALLRQDGGP